MSHVNGTIPLMEGEIQIDRGGSGVQIWVKASAYIRMQLSPTPRVFIEAHVRQGLVPNIYGLKRSNIRLPDGPTIAVNISNCTIDAGNCTIFPTTDSCLLVPACQPVTCIKTGERLQSVSFDILNFPSLFRYDRPVELCDEPWCIEIRPSKDLAAIKEKLKVESGYAFTHKGSVKRSDGRSFRVEEAEAVLRRVRHFLSFARGAGCGIALIVGKDENGNKAWEQWGSYQTCPWFPVSSWLDHRLNNEQELAQAYPGFVQMLDKEQYTIKDKIYTALFWYLCSNESRDPYSGTILTQAALERLSGKNEEDLGKALEEARIGCQLPSSCRELAEWDKSNGGNNNGPNALRRARNNLVHPDVRCPLSEDAQREIYDLGLWYTELLLLRKCGYMGRYANRLKYRYDGYWEPDDVPWAR